MTSGGGTAPRPRAHRSHGDTVRTEFARQAQSFADFPILAGDELTRPLLKALAVAPPGRALDLACGPGVVTCRLAPLALQVLALDLTRETLRVARTRCRDAGVDNVAFATGAAESLPCADASFDAVALRLALHHVERPAAVLRECRRVLRPGGRLLLLDLTTSADPEEAALHDAIEKLRDPSHVALETPQGLRARVVDAGFLVDSHTAWSSVRHFGEWARIIAEPVRMASLRALLVALARAGVGAGIDLHERDGELCFRYTLCWIEAHPAP